MDILTTGPLGMDIWTHGFLTHLGRLKTLHLEDNTCRWQDPSGRDGSTGEALTWRILLRREVARGTLKAVESLAVRYDGYDVSPGARLLGLHGLI